MYVCMLVTQNNGRFLPDIMPLGNSITSHEDLLSVKTMY